MINPALYYFTASALSISLNVNTGTNGFRPSETCAVSVVAGAAIKISNQLKTQAGITLNIGYNAQLGYRQFTFTGYNTIFGYALNGVQQLYRYTNAKIRVYIRVDASNNGSTGELIFLPYEVDYDGRILLAQGETIVEYPDITIETHTDTQGHTYYSLANTNTNNTSGLSYYYIHIGTIALPEGGTPENPRLYTRSWLNAVQSGQLETAKGNNEEGEGAWTRMFRLSPSNIIELLLPFDKIFFYASGDTFINRITNQFADAVEDFGSFTEWAYNNTVATTKSVAAYIKSKIDELDDKYFRKDQPDTSPHLATFGDVHVAAGLPNGEDATSDGNLNVDNDATILGDILGKKNATIEGILKALAQILSNRIESDNWSGDGTFDSGFRLQKAADGITSLVVDNLFVRMKAIFNELEIRKISYAGGNIIFSHAGSKVVYVSKIYEGDIEYQDYIIVLDDNALLNGRGIFGIDGSYEEGGIYLEGAHLEPNPVPPPPESKVIAYRCYLMKDDGTTATENWWRVDDQARCQTFNVVEPGTYQNAENTFYWRRVIATGSQKLSDGKTYDYVDLSREDRWHSESFDSDIPQAGDQIVQMGNRTDAERQGFISIEVYGEDAPAFKVYRNVNGYTLEGKRKICISPKVTEIRAQKFITETEYDVCRVPQQRSTPWYEGMQCYYYDLLQHNGSTWLCTYPEEGVGGVKYTTEEPSETATYWSVYAQKGPQGESGLTPRIVDGYWWIGDTSTGIKAEGDDGLTPYIGANGNWWIGTTDTGVQAEAQSALHIDLSNQMDGVAMESDGKVSAQEVLETDVALYYGTQKMGLTSLTYSTLPTGVTASINPATGHVTITVAKDTTFANDKLDITFTATCQKGTMAMVFTIQGFRAGADGTSPVIYQLVPSEVAMKKDKTGTYTPATLTCSVTKRDGNNAPVPYTGSDVTIKMSIDGGSEQPYASITTNTTKPALRVTYKLYQGTTLIDVETVHVTEDGIDGESPYFADIDNEMDSVSCDADGKTTAAYDVYIGVHVWHGSTEEALTKLQTNSITGFTITPDKTNKRIRIQVASGTTISTTNKITITAASANSGDKTLSFVLNGVRAGADGSPAILYSLVPSVSSVAKKKDGSYSVNNISCTRQKNVGGTITDNTTDGTIECYVDDVKKSSYSNNENIAVTTFTKSVKFVFKVGGVVVDTETIPMVEDGTNGVNTANLYLEQPNVFVQTDKDNKIVVETGNSYVVEIPFYVIAGEQALAHYSAEISEGGTTHYATLGGAGVYDVSGGVLTREGTGISIEDAYISGNGIVMPNGATFAPSTVILTFPKNGVLDEHKVNLTVVALDNDGNEYTVFGAIEIQHRKDGEDGADGADGANGYNTATIMLYKRSSSAVTSVGISSTLYYKFSTRKLYTDAACTTEATSQLNGWSLSIPTNSTDPIYVTAAVAYSNTDVDNISSNEWVDVAHFTENGVDGANGTNGINTATVFIYKRSSSAPGSTDKPSGTVRYTFATGAKQLISGSWNSWQTSIPSGTDPCYVRQAVALGNGTTDDIASSDWSDASKLVQDGTTGARGADGVDISLSGGNIIFTQSMSAGTDQSGALTITPESPEVEVKVNKGGTPVTSGVTVSILSSTGTFEHYNPSSASVSGRVVTVSKDGIQTYAENGKYYPYTDGFLTVRVTYNGSSYDFIIRFVVNPMGKFKTEVEGDVETSIANKEWYEYNEATGQYDKTTTLGEYIRSSSKNQSTLTQKENDTIVSMSEILQKVDKISLTVQDNTPTTDLFDHSAGGTNTGDVALDDTWKSLGVISTNTRNYNTVAVSLPLTCRFKQQDGTEINNSRFRFRLYRDTTAGKEDPDCLAVFTFSGGELSSSIIFIDNTIKQITPNFTIVEYFTVTGQGPSYNGTYIKGVLSFTISFNDPFKVLIAQSRRNTTGANFTLLASRKLIAGNSIETGLRQTGIFIEQGKIINKADQWECQNNSGVKTAWLDDLGNFTIRGVYNNLITVIDSTNCDKYIISHTENDIKTWYLDVLLCGTFVKIEALPSEFTSQGGNKVLNLPFYANDNLFCRGYTRYLAASGSTPRQMTADELRMLAGRKIVIGWSDSLGATNGDVLGYIFEPEVYYGASNPTLSDVRTRLRSLMTGQKHFLTLGTSMQEAASYNKSPNLYIPRTFLLSFELVKFHSSQTGSGASAYSWGYIWMADDDGSNAAQEAIDW